MSMINSDKSEKEVEIKGFKLSCPVDVVHYIVAFPRSTIYNQKMSEATLCVLANRPCNTRKEVELCNCSACKYILLILAAGITVSCKDRDCLIETLKVTDEFPM
jgi:hypothetical protein